MKNPKNSSTQYISINAFVKKLSLESRRKTYKLVRILFNEANLAGETAIEIPFHLLEKNKISKEDATAILKNLDKNNVAKTLLTLREHKSTRKKPGISMCKSITEDKKVFNSRAKIYLKEGGLKYLKQLLEKNKIESDNNDLQKISLPRNKGFKDVIIKFLKDYSLEISIGDKIEKIHSEELGLLKTNNGKYIGKKCFDFLMQLSAIRGVCPLENLSLKEREEKTSRKKELKKILQGIFGTGENPFFRYNRNSDCIEIKIKLIPSKELKETSYEDRNIYDKGEKNKSDPFRDVKEYYKDETCC
jgi:hypothetical protein